MFVSRLFTCNRPLNYNKLSISTFRQRIAILLCRTTSLSCILHYWALAVKRGWGGLEVQLIPDNSKPRLLEPRANSNQSRFLLDFLLETWSKFCIPTDNLYITLPSVTRTMFQKRDKSENKTLYWRPNHWIYSKTTVSILCPRFFVTSVQIHCPSLYINQALLLNPFFKIQLTFITCCPWS